MKKAENNDKDNILYNYNLANLYIENNKYSKAKRILNAIEEENGISEKVSISKAILFSRSNKLDMAIFEINKLIKSYPEKSEFYGLVSEYCIDNEDYTQANKYLSYLFEINPHSKKGLFVLADYYKKQNLIQQYDSLTKVIFSSVYISLNEKVDYFNNVYKDLNFNKDSLLITSIFDILLEMYNSDKSLYSFLSDYYIQHKQYKKAQNELLLLKKYNYSNPVVWHQLLSVTDYLDDPLLSEYADEAITNFPNEPLFIWFKGLGFYKENEIEKSIKVLNKISIERIPSKELKLQYFEQINGFAVHSLSCGYSCWKCFY